MNIEGEYPAYCFNEACMFLLQALEDGKKLKFVEKEQRKHFRSASEMYESLGVSV